VSMAVMDLQVGGSHACWLAATDTGRNFVLDPRSQRIVRNLYGHVNDGYSQPKVAWACPTTNGGSYVFGNTQDESVVCVWDVASSKLVDKLEGHGAPIRDLDSSETSDILVTTAFDKSTRVWYPNSSMTDC
jgi:WD40 repeat protein